MTWTGRHFDFIEDPDDDGIDRVAPYVVVRKFIDACDADHELVMARNKRAGWTLPNLGRLWHNGK